MTEQPRPGGTRTLGYVDAAGMHRNAELYEHTTRIREYAERHRLMLIYTYVDGDGPGFRRLLDTIRLNLPDRILVSRLSHLATPVVTDGEPVDETKHQVLERFGIPVQEVFP